MQLYVLQEKPIFNINTQIKNTRMGNTYYENTKQNIKEQLPLPPWHFPFLIQSFIFFHSTLFYHLTHCIYLFIVPSPHQKVSSTGQGVSPRPTVLLGMQCPFSKYLLNELDCRVFFPPSCINIFLNNLLQNSQGILGIGYNRTGSSTSGIH